MTTKKVGRPATGPKNPYQFQIRADDQLYAILDDWRRAQPDMPSRSEAARRIIKQIAPQKRRGAA